VLWRLILRLWKLLRTKEPLRFAVEIVTMEPSRLSKQTSVLR
jgi:hypothetical protein